MLIATARIGPINEMVRICAANPDHHRKDHPSAPTPAPAVRISVASSCKNVTYTYDSASGCTSGIGRLCSVTDETGTINYAYDGFGHLMSEALSENNVTYSTAYDPDPFGAVLDETYPDGRVITYTRDRLERITSVTATINGTATTLLSSRTFRADNRVSGQTWGNGLAETRSYDFAGRLQTQTVGTDTRVYGYDANGNLTSLQTLPQVDCPVYDVLDRLSANTVSTASGASCPAATPGTLYQYDGNGNRLSKTTGTTTVPYVYTAVSNRLASVGGKTVTLNKIGGIFTNAAGQNFVYDNAGRLIQAGSGAGLELPDFNGGLCPGACS